MRLIIDCFKLVKGMGKSVGIYNVAVSLVQNLVLEKSRTTDQRIRDTEIIVLGNQYNVDDFGLDGVVFKLIDNYDPLNKFHAVLWELFIVSGICKALKADKVLFPRGYCALSHRIYDIVLIHDMIPFYYKEHFPDVFNRVENAYIMKRLKASARGAKKVITISEASKREIIKYCKVNADKIQIIHNACNAIHFAEEKQVQEEPYICAMTSGLPHKNAKGVLESYSAYCKITDEPLNLVVIGLQDTSLADLSEDVKSRITCYKFIKKNDEMYRLMNNSSVFLFLSLVEGFGLPPIEAMMLKVPVVCSDRSSIPETAGDAAILVDPCNPQKVAESLARLLNDPEKQKELVIKGVRNTERFSWDSRAKLYWDAILSMS